MTTEGVRDSNMVASGTLAFQGGEDERKSFGPGRNINGGHIPCDCSLGDSDERTTATDGGVGVSMETFFDRLSWKLLLIAVPFSMAIIIPGLYLIWQGVGK